MQKVKKVKTIVDFKTTVNGDCLRLRMYEGSESGFCIPAVGDIVAFDPGITSGTEFEKISDFFFRVYNVARFYGEKQDITVSISPVSKNRAESDGQQCLQDVFSVY